MNTKTLMVAIAAFLFVFEAAVPTASAELSPVTPQSPGIVFGTDRTGGRAGMAGNGRKTTPLTVAEGEMRAEYAPGEIIVKFRGQPEPGGRRSGRVAAEPDPRSVLENAGLAPEGMGRVHSIRPAAAKERKAALRVLEVRGAYSLEGKTHTAASSIESLSDDILFRQAQGAMSDLEKGLYRTYTVTLPEGTSVEDALEKLAGNPNIEYAEPNYIFRTLMVPDDPYYQSSGSWNQSYDDLWGIKKIYADRAWDITQGEGVVVAVIDTGVDYTHEDLRDNIWLNEDEIPGNGIDDDENGYVDDVRGWDFAYGDNDPSDVYGHGSHVAGTIAATGNNALGVIGVAPKAKIMIVKGLNDGGKGYESELAGAVKYVADNGAHVTNNSWGGTGRSEAIEDAFNYAYSKNVLSLAAAGNTGGGGVHLPAKYESVVAVSASDPDDELTYFSSYGDKVEVSAPGGGKKGEEGVQDSFRNVLSTMPDNSALAKALPHLKVSPGYWRLAGTSMATPHAAGVAALIRSRYPQFTNEQAREKLKSSAHDLGEPARDKYFGYGKVDAYFAVRNYSLSITSPGKNAFVRGGIDVIGSASMEDGFQKYELSVAPKSNPNNTTVIATSTTPVQDGVLGVWDTAQYGDGEYYLSLRIYSTDDSSLQRVINVITDNVNQSPAFINLRDKKVIVGSLLQFMVEAMDPDDPSTPWGQLTYSAFDLPEGAAFDPQTRMFSWTPSESQKGKNYDVTFRVEDSEHTVDSSITISIVELVGKEIASITSPDALYRADIHENNIVWMAWNPQGRCSLYLYDISKDETTELTSVGTMCVTYTLKDVAIHGNRVAYPAAEGGIWLYDLGTREKKKISSLPEAAAPDIYGDTVVWMARSGVSSQFKVYMYDIPTAMEKPIGLLPNQSYQVYPTIEGDLVVYKGYTDGYAEIFLYNAATGEHRELLRNTDDRVVLGHHRQLYQDKLVFEGSAGARGARCNGDPNRPPTGTHDELETFFDFFLHDIPTGNEMRITPDFPILEYGIGFYGESVAWTDRREIIVTEWVYEPIFGCWYISKSDWNTNIYISDTSGAGNDLQITNSPLPEESPILYKNKLVYFAKHDPDVRNVGSLFLYELYFVPQIVSITPTEASRGGVITITGKNLGYDEDGGNSFVQFAPGVRGTVRSWSNTEIVVEVPQDAVSGEVKVITKGGESNGVWLEIIGGPPPGDELCLSSTLQHRARHGMTHELSSARLTVTDTVTGTVAKEASLPLNEQGEARLTDTSSIVDGKAYDLTLKPRGHLALAKTNVSDPFASCHAMGEAKHGDYNESGAIDLSDLITAINYHVKREESPHREKFEDMYRLSFGLADIVEVIRNYVETR